MLPKDKASKILKGCKAKPSTRSIIVDDTAGNSFQLADANGNCRPEKRKSSLTRSIIVDVEDDSGFGVVEDEALSGDSFLSLIVNLNHI
jgi:hypothetical protein